MAKVLVALADGFEDIEAVNVVDVLRRGGIEVVTASIHDRADVKSAHGITMRADALFADVADDSYEAIVLPGGGEGTANLKRCEPLLERLRRQSQEGLFLCAICAAPTVLVEAGVLGDDQHITCYPTCVMDIDRPSANVPAVADGNVITGQGPGSALLFSLVVLQALAGERVASRVARAMVTDVLNA
jgi:4-methyl-5(b-hydroxyethyl)-thiazole monophosphate biosynthesis